MRHLFKAIKPQRMLRVGDLIRSDATGNFINIVLEVIPIKGPLIDYWGKKREGEFFDIRSVRYGKTNHGNFIQLDGKRSKLFVYPTINLTNWEIVDEFVELDNRVLRARILEDLEGVNTCYKQEETSNGATNE